MSTVTIILVWDFINAAITFKFLFLFYVAVFVCVSLWWVINNVFLIFPVQHKLHAIELSEFIKIILVLWIIQTWWLFNK
jgi:hypothetical protein